MEMQSIGSGSAVKSALLVALSLMACWGQAPQAAAFNGVQYLQFLPSGNAWRAMSSWRLEFRIHNFTRGSQPQGIIGNNDGDWQCQITADSENLRCRAYRGTDDHMNLSLAGRTDVRVRMQRNNDTGRMSLEIWNGDGSGYAIAQTNFTPGVYNGQRRNFIGSLWGAGSQMRGFIDFARAYTGVVALNAPPPLDRPAQPGDLLNIDFDGEVRDTSENQFELSLQGGGSLTYAASKTFPPVVSLRAPSAARAGMAVTVDLGGSYALNGDGTLASLTITQTGGPIGVQLTGQNGAALELIFPVTGTYLFTVKATDQLGIETEVERSVAAVAADSAGRVLLFDESARIVLGPLLRSGESPWPWFDQTEVQIADALAASIEDSPGQPIEGTIEVRKGNREVTGTGTRFRSVFKCDGTDNIAVHYPIDGDTGTPRRTGLRVYTVSACASDTQMTISPAYDATQFDWRSVRYGRVTNEENARWYNGSNNWNYYDAALAYYRLYYRTGDEKYRLMARTVADRWYRYPLDEGRACNDGYWCVAPRMMGMLGLMLRAQDGRPELWPFIVKASDTAYRSFIQNWIRDTSMNVYDLREAGYAAWWQAALAGMHPDAEVRQAALAKAKIGYEQYWKPRQHPDGSWRMDIFYACPSCGYEGPGTLPWQMAFPLHALTALHRLTGDEEVLASIQKGIAFIGEFGMDKECRGMLYDVFYTKCNGGPCGQCPFGSCGKYNCRNNGAYASNPSRTLSNAMHAIYGYLYYATGNAAYLTAGDELFGANLGQRTGPFSDGGHGNYNDAVSGGAAPQFLARTYLSKEFGFVGGAGGAQNYLAWRLGPPAEPVLAEVDVVHNDLASVSPQAVSARAILLRPSGQQEGFDCEEGRCRIRFTVGIGRHLYRIQYLDAEGKVVSDGTFALLPEN